MSSPPEAAGPRPSAGAERFLRVFAFVGFGVSGASALAYEVIWTRKLATIMGSSTYAMSTILAAFMAGLALGALAGAFLSPRVDRPLRLFGFCEVGIGLSALFTIPAIKAASPLYVDAFFLFRGSFTAFTASQFILAFAIVLIPTTLMGMTFPLLVKFCADGSGDIGKRAGLLYGLNTVGAVLGSLAAGFVLIPVLGATDGTLVAAGLNLATGATVLVAGRALRRPVLLIPVVLLGLAFAAGANRPYVPFISMLNAHRFMDAEFVEIVRGGVSRADPGEVVVFRHEGVESDVYLMRDVATGGLSLLNNGKLEGGENSAGFALLASLAYFSAPAEPARLEVLNIGLGSGYTLSRLAAFERTHIVSVELSEGVLEATRLHVRPELFDHPRIEHVLADGRNFLMVQPDGHFDAIVVSPSWAVELASASLLTDEFFELAAQKLAPNGVIAVWQDPFIAPEEDLHIVFRTFRRHFQDYSAWMASDGLVLVGAAGTFGRAPAEVARLVLAQAPELAEQFEPYLDRAAIEALPDGVLNTDDRPVIEFHNAQNIITRSGL